MLTTADNYRVLIAEDEPDSRALISYILEQEGVEVTSTENGQQCLDRALAAWDDDKPFDLILVDIQMPELDGKQTARELRSRGYTMPIVAMTARTGEQDMQEAIISGCNDFVSKLSGKSNLINAVKKQLSKETVIIDHVGELPVLPIVPEILKSNPAFAKSALELITRIPEALSTISEGIRAKDFEQVRQACFKLSAASLCGYKIFAEHILVTQTAAESHDQRKLIASYPALVRSSKAVVAGKKSVSELI